MNDRSEKTAVENGPQDIVARLRKTTDEWPTDWDLVSVLSDAADEIERLREKLIRMGQLPTGDGYMPQVLLDGVWTDLFTMCVDRLLTARVVTTAVPAPGRSGWHAGRGPVGTRSTPGSCARAGWCGASRSSTPPRSLDDSLTNLPLDTDPSPVLY